VIGFDSTSLIIFTSVFTGMVLGLQFYTTMKQFGAESALGLGVAVTLFTELAPVLGALLLIGRAGSSMCAELGVMRISDQISVLDSMGIDSYNYLIGPKVLASILCFPVLSFLFAIVGVGGAYMAGVMILGVNSASFYDGVIRAMAIKNLVPMCLYKSLIFGLITVFVCAFKGYFVGLRGAKGAMGVSRATTEAVVYASVTILLWDYLITSLLL
jgi:phospholipid/cholesterol/gamma-HCH transport system permease protein